MRLGGIFNGFGAAELAGQTLKLAPASQGGSAPLAQAVQQIIKDQGFGKLAVDGKWGDCSQKAFINAYGTAPTPQNIVQWMGLDAFGVQPSQVSTWNKSNPICTNGTSSFTNDVNPNLDKFAVVASAFGVPYPGSGQACPQGSYRNVQTGKCEQFETPQTIAPAAPLMKLVSMPSTGPTMTTIPLNSENKTSIKPVAVPVRPPSTSLLAPLKVSPITTTSPAFTVAPIKWISDAVTGAGPGGAQSAGMSPIAKGALALGGLALVAGGGYWLWKRSQNPPVALPNCGYDLNCGE